jgi:hypothetical protein
MQLFAPQPSIIQVALAGPILTTISAQPAHQFILIGLLVTLILKQLLVPANII